MMLVTHDSPSPLHAIGSPHGPPPARGSDFSPLSELPGAIDQGDLMLLYQPKIDLATSQVTRCEALVRWRHPSHGTIEPSGFVPLLEQAGAIGPLTDWVIDAAVAQLARWFEAQMPIGLAINVTASDLLDPHLADTLRRALDTHAVPADAVRLELANGRQPHDGAQRVRAAQRIARTGVSLSLDDYGAPQSSPMDVRDLPVEELKIDRAYIDTLLTDVKARAIVRSTIDLGRSLGLAVVAEGIETAEQWTLLKRMGCSHGQGYLFSAPLGALQLAAWLRHWPYGCPLRRGARP